MGSGRPSIAKRQRELKQIERRQAKEAKRAERKAEKANRAQNPGMEISGEQAPVTPES
jgi:hypothetical protein